MMPDGGLATPQGTVPNSYSLTVQFRYCCREARWNMAKAATQSRVSRAAVGAPPALAARALRTFRARDAETAYAYPRPQLARLEHAGALHRPAWGYYVVVPQ